MLDPDSYEEPIPGITEPNYDEHSEFTEEDQKLLDSLFKGMTEEDIKTWMNSGLSSYSVETKPETTN
tara:strand:+ start:369 stop:569 length:201 start_codon:yes stop_codon:yes gene_type:complete